ncbi:MAG: acetyl-CoA carboxylase biotin carboxyl carrier protein [Candidatus Marinimicrobia bacterium]|nr:acetyl-CoA carboxylase biotin carboxyl carrier protein [Candidatus Neomarinimicrobiota bacterium]
MGLREKIEEIISIIEDFDVNEVEVSTWWGRKIRVAKRPASGLSTAPATAPAQVPVATSVSATDESAAEPAGHAVRSPIVGTFYRSASPDTDPFIRVGDRIKVGQTICIIEAMKIMNEIESDMDGVVLEILPENASPVEFNQPLVIVGPG